MFLFLSAACMHVENFRYHFNAFAAFKMHSKRRCHILHFRIDRSRRYILDLKLNNFSFLLTLSSKSKKVHIYEKGKLHTIGLEDLNIPLALSYACTKISEKCNLSPMRLSEGVQKIPAYLKKY